MIHEGYSEKRGLLRLVKKKGSFPSEATFSRTVKEFAESELGDKVHRLPDQTSTVVK